MSKTTKDANASTSTEQSNVSNETTTQAHVVAITPAPATIDDLRKTAQEAAQKSASAIMDESLTDAQRLEISLNAYKAAKAVQDKINADKKAEAEQAATIEREKRAAIYDDAIVSYDAFLAAKVVYDASSKGAEDIAAMNDAYAKYNAAADVVRNALKNGIVKKELFVPMGTTGATVAKSARVSGEPSKTEILIERMKAGATNEELKNEGYADGTVRSARWQYNSQLKAAK